MISEQLQKKIDRSIKLLKSVAKGYDGVIEVAYSGGKDSDVILQLAKEAGINYKAIYKNTTIDPPGTIAHAKAMGAEVINPKKTFFQLMQEHGLPSRYYRFCCSELKEYQADKSIHKTIIGVRKSESRKRKERYNEPTECLGTKTSPYEAVYPLLDWTDADVRDFILDRKMQCAPVYYDMGGVFHVERRLGCMCCPLLSKKRRIADFKKNPRMLRAYARNAKIYFDTHPNVNVVSYFADIYEWLTCYLIYESNFKKFSETRDGLFGKPDYKAFLEEQFDIDLTL